MQAVPPQYLYPDVFGSSGEERDRKDG